MRDLTASLAEAQRLRALFEAQGATPVDADILQPADLLLDLYGEDIRGRAYLTHDPIRGEMVMRPDFTVPVVQTHMDSGADPARYTYAGKVFRMQDGTGARPSEYVQVGFEVFDGANPAEADATVFAAIAEALVGLPVTPATGDIGILKAAIGGLRTSEARKAALLRHIWRPGRFRSLLDRFGGRSAVPPSRAALLAEGDPLGAVDEVPGKRSRAEIADRIAALRADAATAPLAEEERELIDALLAVRETCPYALSALRDIAVDMPAVQGAVQGLARRLDALSDKGIDVDALPFEGSYGRTTLEYYDGFVFGFTASHAPEMPPVATGGRYDALTAQLGSGQAAPAVGGVIRPDLVLGLRGGV